MNPPSSKPNAGARATSDNGFSTIVPSDSSPSTARHKQPMPTNVTNSGWQPAQDDLVDQEEHHRLRNELEKLKVATMHSMVDRVVCDVEDNPVDLSCLYLTNVQASEVPIQSMPKVRQELGLKEPKMVIRLMPSHFGSTYWQTFANWTAGPEGGRFPTKSIPELSDEAEDRTEHQLMLLAKDVLLPLASRTQALVIGSESCALTAAFVKVSAPTERQMGDACPFRLLIFARTYFFHVKSLKQGTTAYQVRQACKTWMQADFRAPLTRMFGEDEAFWPCEDFSTGKYSLIMFDCLGPSGLAHETANNFQNDFISSLSQELPVIALQTYGTNKMNMVPALAEHVTRGLPLMLLDSRPRHPSRNLDEAAHELLCFSEELHHCQRKPGGPRADQYFTSVLAFIKGTLDSRRRYQAGPLKRTKQDVHLGMEEELPDSRLWIHEAIQRRLAEDGNERTNAEAKRSRVALEEDHDLMNATELVMSYTGGELEWESWVLQERCADGIKDVLSAATWEDFARKLDENWLRIRSCCFHSFQNARVFAAENHWIVLDEHRRQSPKGTKILRILLDSPDVFYTQQTLEEAKKRLGKLLGDSLQVSKDYDQRSKTRRIFMSNEAMWLAVYDILKAGNVHAGNLHHLAQVNGTLFSLAQIDRLPSQNTLEALVLLRTAWTTVDVYNSRAATYKVYAKAVYFLTLLLGLTTVSFTVLCRIYPAAVSEQQQSHVLLALALCGTLLTGYAALVDPARKWLQLRNGAFSLEAEIWKFRTRVGEYQGSQASATYHGRMIDERRAEEVLQSAILRVQGRVRLSTGLKETGFYAVPMATNDLRKPVEEEGVLARTTSAINVLLRKASVTTVPPNEATRKFLRAHYQHGQYRKESHKPLQKGHDSHHAPARPEDYIRFRLAPKLQFYQQRIPRYAVRRRMFQGLLLLSSLATSLLAALGKPNWTAIVAAFSGAVAGWQEFVDVAKKLQRYSTTSASLSNMLSWWQKLTEVEQASVKNISLLVERTEGLLSDERCAWVSDAQQTLRLVSSDGKKEGGTQAKPPPEA